MKVLGRLVLATTVAVMGCWGWAAQADAFVYWGDDAANTIGRANLDGSDPTGTFIGGASVPFGVAVDGRYVYWTATGTNTIGRANLDGTGANPSFITVSAGALGGMAVDGEHVFWADRSAGTIGRANLDGSGADESFITGAGVPVGLAVDGKHVYWTTLLRGTVGRANLDGSGVEQDFITGANDPRAVAVDGAHVYWTNVGAGTIGRANVDGTDVERSFIGGASAPFGLAVDGQHVYWSNFGRDEIGRANLDGSGIDQDFIAGVSHPRGLAVDGGPAGSATASATSVGFGTQPLGTLGSPRSVTITNTGHGLLSIDTARVATDDVNDFLVSHDTCSHSTLTVGASCTVQVRFGPSAGGARRATLELISNDPAAPLQITLQGTAGDLPQGPTGAAGSAGPPGPAGPAGPAGADRELLMTAFAAGRQRAVRGQRLRLRYFSTLAARITIEVRRGRRVVKRVRRTAARGRNSLVVRVPRARGRYSLRLVAAAGTQRATDRSLLIVNANDSRTSPQRRRLP